MEGTPIGLWRCYICGYLLTDRHTRKDGKCPKCGSRKFRGGSPLNLIEWIKCWWWDKFLQ